MPSPLLWRAPGGSRLLEPKFHYNTRHEKSQQANCTNFDTSTLPKFVHFDD